MRIDVHAHCYTPEFMDRMLRLGCTWRPSDQILRASAATQERIEQLAAAGVDLQILSVGAQQPYLAQTGDAVEAATLANDFYKEVVDKGQGRYAAFGCVPLPHVGEAIAEARRCLDDMGFVGINLGCSVAGRPLEAPEFQPFWDELDRRHTVVFLHPVGVGGMMMDDLAWTLGAPFEDTVAAMRLVRSGLMDRVPNVKIIVPHLGGTVPFLWQRMENALGRQRTEGRSAVVATMSAGLKRLYYDTVNQAPASLRCACQTIGADRLILGTDYPYQSPEECVAYVEGSGLDPVEVAAILDRNAPLVFGLSRAEVTPAELRMKS